MNTPLKTRITVDQLLFYTFLCAFLGMPLGTAPSNICGGIAALIWIFSGRFIKQKNIYRQVWFWPVLILIILPWAGLLYTPEITETSIKYAKKTHYWLYGLAIASISYKHLSPRRFAYAFLLGLAVNALVAVLQVADFIPVRGTAGYCGFFKGYRALSTYLVLGILMVSYFFRESKDNRARLLTGLLLLLYTWNLFMLEGRNGYFTFFVLSPLFIRNIFKGTGPLRTSLFCILFLTFLFLSPFARDRIFTFTANQINAHLNADPANAWGKKNIAGEDRFYITRNAVIVFLKHPIFGVGTGGFLHYTEEKGRAISHPHNNFLYMAVSYGIIGVLALAWLFWEVIKNAWKQRHTPIGFFVLSASLVIFVSGTFNTQILDTGTAFLFAVSVGLQSSFRDTQNGFSV